MTLQSLFERRVLKTFDQFDLDGMRTREDLELGKLFAARTDAGTVARYSLLMETPCGRSRLR